MHQYAIHHCSRLPQAPWEATEMNMNTFLSAISLVVLFFVTTSVHAAESNDLLSLEMTAKVSVDQVPSTMGKSEFKITIPKFYGNITFPFTIPSVADWIVNIGVPDNFTAATYNHIGIVIMEKTGQRVYLNNTPPVKESKTSTPTDPNFSFASMPVIYKNFLTVESGKPCQLFSSTLFTLEIMITKRP